MFLIGNSTTQDKYENKERDGSTLSRGMRYRP